MKPIEKIYHAFYRSGRGRLYFNELKEFSGLKDSSLDRNLRILTDKKEIRKEKSRSNTYYSLINDELRAIYFSKFSIEKFESLDYRIKIPLKELKENISNIRYVVHFGSTSRGEEKEDSDIDLLVVLENFEDKELDKLYQKDIRERLEELRESVNSKSVYTLSIFYVDEKEFLNDGDYLIQSAKETGYPIYNQFGYHLKNGYKEVNR